MLNPVRVALITDEAALNGALHRLTSSSELASLGLTDEPGRAVELFERSGLEVALLDVDMAGGRGGVVLRALHAAAGKALPIVTLRTEGARRAVRAGLALTTFSPEAPWEDAGLAQRVVSLGLRRRRAASEPVGRAESLGPVEASPRARLVVVAASTGGPQALMRLIPTLGAGFPVPVVVVQHMTPGLVQGLVERLDQVSAASVRLAVSGQPLVAGQVYFAESGHHLALRRSDRWGFVFVDVEGPPRNGVRPSADTLFESAAREAGGGAIGVVLTGLGCDATGGAGAIRAAGGRVLVESRFSALAHGMPESVVQAGFATASDALDGIARRLMLWVHGADSFGSDLERD